MSDITLPFSTENRVIIPHNIVSAAPLSYIRPLHNSLQFGSSSEHTPNGRVWNQQVVGHYSNAERAVIDQLDTLLNKRLFIVFKDNTGQYRFMVDAFLSYETDTNTILGEAASTFSFTKKTSQQHYFYTGAATIAADGTLSFT
jgi:hypothetical protein